MNQNFRTIHVTERQLTLFIVYLLIALSASIGMLGLMSQAVSNDLLSYFFYDQSKFNISLFLPLIFFILLVGITLPILLTGKEKYQFSAKVINSPKKIHTVITFIEMAQLILWVFFLLILITYFFPINQSVDQIYQTKTTTVDFANDQIYSGLLAFIKIDNNFFVDLKRSIIDYAAILPYFYNKNTFIFYNVVYLVFYLGLFLSYIKLALFKSKQRVLALIPFVGLVISLKSSNNLNEQALDNDSQVNLKWYQKILESNKSVFEMKLTKQLFKLLIFYIFWIVVFTISAALITFLNQGEYKLNWSLENNKRYVIDLRSEVSIDQETLATIQGTILFLIPIPVFIGSIIFLVLNKNPYVFSAKLTKNKLKLSLVLIIMEIIQLLFIVAYPHLIAAIPNLATFAVIRPTVFLQQPVNPLLSAQDMFTIGIGFLVVLYSIWFLIFIKSGVFAQRAGVLSIVPFASLFFVNKYMVANNTNSNNNNDLP